MSQTPISPMLRAWYKWKTLRLPWRRQFLIGLDLNGNTYWEFLDPGSRLPPSNPSHPLTSPVRWRRIVRYPGNTHPSAVLVPPAWHQWLRHTRADPPSLAEQRAEVARQARIKVLAAEADARWEAKPRVMEDVSPAGGKKKVLGVRQPAFETERHVGPGSKVTAEKRAEAGETSGTGPVTDEVKLGDSEVVNQREETWKQMKKEAEGEGGKEREAGKKTEKGPDPWRQDRGGPSESWQPKAWEPAARGKK
ncbi:hypothetical protein C8A01DRAFT_16108 [Parachaetomium inaequale]|uniref:NADH dehydrogenase [ubiquinone] 1 alpha subcomplex subunit n=1 Tax=Parachaetomium inaequale TaxID=2588326 RepID=A0AAN6SS05_9PEZI|nr:hypothetical protein C8A01DRAFT_16108 [Parachaetomium inaequale]